MRRIRDGVEPGAIAGRTRDATRKAVLERARLSADALESAWRRVMVGARTGRVYSYNGRKYRASAAGSGEPPAERSGAFARTFRVSTTIEEHAGHYAARLDIESPKAYAQLLARGTSRMAARPIVEPVVREAQSELDSIAHRRIAL